MKNWDVKTIITIVALVLWVGSTAFGFYAGQFDTVWDFFKQAFLMVISYYLGTKVEKETKDDSTEYME